MVQLEVVELVVADVEVADHAVAVAVVVVTVPALPRPTTVDPKRFAIVAVSLLQHNVFKKSIRNTTSKRQI